MDIETKIYDNAIPKQLSDKILSLIDCSDMNWFLNDSTCEKIDGIWDCPQFVHEVYRDGEVLSSLFQDVSSVLMYSGLPIAEIQRIKVNLLFNHGATENEHNPWHKDADEDYYTLLYYINDSDGCTEIKESDGSITEVLPSKGRFVVFESNKMHHSTPPSDPKSKRMVINFIVKKPKTEEN